MREHEREGFHVGIHGPGRGDALSVCVERMLHMFRLLKEVDPTLAQWFDQGWTLEEALERRLDLDRDALAKAFRKHTVRDAAWYFMSAWNGKSDEDSCAFHASCGHTDPGDADSLIFNPREAGPTGERIIQAPVLARLLRALVSAWEPQTGIVISSRHDEAAFAHAKFEYRIGWINFFSHKLGALPPLPSPVRTELVENKGSLVILTPERWSTSNPEHVALSLRVSKELKDAGVLRPLLQPASQRP